MSTVRQFLAEVPLFALMDEEERASLADLMEERCLHTGETLFKAGDAGDSLVIVRNGRLQIFLESTEGEKIILGDIGAGQMLGEVSLFDPGPRSATAIAVEHTDILAFDHGDLWKVLQQKPHIAVDMLTVMGKRLRATDELLRTHVTRNLNTEEEERLTFPQRLADRVAAFGGSWTFIVLFTVVLVGWIALNSLLLARKPFDPYPYILLNLVLSMIAAVQAPVIMMSQNRQATKERLRGELDYEVNLKAELEVAQLHSKVDRIYETMSAALLKMEKERSARAAAASSSPAPK